MKKLVAMMLAMCVVFCATMIAYAETERAQTSLGYTWIDVNSRYTVEENLSNGGIPMTKITGVQDGVAFEIYFYMYPESMNAEISTSGNADAQQNANFTKLLHMAGLSHVEKSLRVRVTNPLDDILIAEAGFGHYVDGNVAFQYLGSRYFAEAGIGCFVSARSADQGEAYITMTLLLLNITLTEESKLAPIREAAAEVAAAKRYVAITADSGKIRTEASISGGLIKTAYKGETFELIREEGDWYVVDVNGRTGYIHKGVAAIQ